MPMWMGLNLHNSSSPWMEHLIFFHDHIMMILILVLTVVAYIMFMFLFNKFVYRFLMNEQTIEVIWTVFPGVILIFIAFPSLYLLYFMEELDNPMLTLKVLGHQWYWSYEYSDIKDLNFDSYMIPSEDLKDDEFRLLEVDNRMVVPYNVGIRVFIGSTDVIHSWTVGGLGLKVDAVPGRLNQLMMYINRPGLFYGQCSEICGVKHSFMPIVLESVNVDTYLNWLNNMN
uniref:cytochrome c oxidase subunit II n=1 Tax=Lophogaster typicus TaxID=419538 RepID=UPI002176D039|nr:cytochrome c oxidase subunit II [Lophogaster typicus]UUL70713.1 cytochrome c oxidase subunit II [Lophogaster typicus]